MRGYLPRTRGTACPANLTDNTGKVCSACGGRAQLLEHVLAYRIFGTQAAQPPAPFGRLASRTKNLIRLRSRVCACSRSSWSPPSPSPSPSITRPVFFPALRSATMAWMMDTSLAHWDKSWGQAARRGWRRAPMRSVAAEVRRVLPAGDGSDQAASSRTMPANGRPRLELICARNSTYISRTLIRTFVRPKHAESASR
jgi:hypothetical protein